MWLYQMDQKQWSPNSYRLDIWENERWSWPVGRIAASERPTAGDRIVFFYAPSGGDDPGIYGWAVLERADIENRVLYFIPAAPTDRLKMDPWRNEEMKSLVDGIRGGMKQATLFEISEEHTRALRAGIRKWLSSKE